MKTVLQIATASLGITVLSACFGQTSYRWREEVQLHDGRMIVIERSVRTGDVPVELGQRPGESDYTLTFKTDNGKTVTWDAGKSFWPMILDFESRVPYIVANASPQNDYGQHDCSRPVYFFFRHSGGRWEQISYAHFPKSIQHTNLSISPTRPDRIDAVSRGLVTLADVKKSHFGLDRFYKEIREDKPMPSACLARGKR